MADFNKPLLGFRTWFCKYTEAGELQRLESITGRATWKPGINKAICKDERCLSCPGVNCHCGMNAYYSFSEALANSYGVVGAVAGSGDIQIHRKGWRASEAQILGLYFDMRGHTLIDMERLTEYYEVPLFDDPEAFVDSLEGGLASVLDIKAQMDSEWKQDLWPLDSIDGQPSSEYKENQAGVIYRTREWRKDGVLHREDDKPALECIQEPGQDHKFHAYFIDNEMLFHHKCIIHPRENEGWKERRFFWFPRDMTTLAAPMKVWCKNGVRHREGAPAAIYDSGVEMWFKDGKLHRVDGPAIVYPDGYEEYWVEGFWRDKEGKSLGFPY